MSAHTPSHEAGGSPNASAADGDPPIHLLVDASGPAADRPPRRREWRTHHLEPASMGAGRD